MLEVIEKLIKIDPAIIHSITIKPIIIGGIFSRIRKKSFVANIVGLGRVFDCDGVIYYIIKKSLFSYIDIYLKP